MIKNLWNVPLMTGPNCREMVDYLIRNDGYGGMSREQLTQDEMLKIVASACNTDIDQVVELTLELLSTKYSGKNYKKSQT